MADLQFAQTKNIPNPNIYVKMLPEYEGWIFLESQAPAIKGRWNSVFANPSQALDLEIGCGNGFFFEHQVRTRPERNLLGIEIKYKPLVQTVRRVKKDELGNGRGLRFKAEFLDHLFAESELNNVFIYFPDPWPRPRQHKHRLLRRGFFEMLHKLQKPGSFVDIKTDSREYFLFIEDELKATPYGVVRQSYNLHQSEWAPENFSTAFEKIFLRKGIEINYVRLQK